LALLQHGGTVIFAREDRSFEVFDGEGEKLIHDNFSFLRGVDLSFGAQRLRLLPYSSGQVFDYFYFNLADLAVDGNLFSNLDLNIFQLLHYNCPLFFLLFHQQRFSWVFAWGNIEG
jgi:hypothetical protein